MRLEIKHSPERLAGSTPAQGLMKKRKKKTKKQLKVDAERSAKIIERLITHPRTAFRKSSVVTAADLHMTPQQKTERDKIMKAKTKRQTTTRKSAKKARGIKGKSGLSICATWLKAFQTKSIKTKAACTKKLKAEFPSRKSAIFNFPNVVVARANKGLLDGKTHKFNKYATK